MKHITQNPDGTKTVIDPVKSLMQRVEWESPEQSARESRGFYKRMREDAELLKQLRWRTLNDTQPTADDANEHGDIEWSDGKDIWQKHWTAYGPGSAIASHWRPITLPQVTK